jgi:hypothetical protein
MNPLIDNMHWKTLKAPRARTMINCKNRVSENASFKSRETSLCRGCTKAKPRLENKGKKARLHPGLWLHDVKTNLPVRFK